MGINPKVEARKREDRMKGMTEDEAFVAYRADRRAVDRMRKLLNYNRFETMKYDQIKSLVERESGNLRYDFYYSQHEGCKSPEELNEIAMKIIELFHDKKLYVAQARDTLAIALALLEYEQLV